MKIFVCGDFRSWKMSDEDWYQPVLVMGSFLTWFITSAQIMNLCACCGHLSTKGWTSVPSHSGATLTLVVQNQSLSPHVNFIQVTGWLANGRLTWTWKDLYLISAPWAVQIPVWAECYYFIHVRPMYLPCTQWSHAVNKQRDSKPRDHVIRISDLRDANICTVKQLAFLTSIIARWWLSDPETLCWFWLG